MKPIRILQPRSSTAWPSKPKKGVLTLGPVFSCFLIHFHVLTKNVSFVWDFPGRTFKFRKVQESIIVCSVARLDCVHNLFCLLYFFYFRILIFKYVQISEQ